MILAVENLTVEVGHAKLLRNVSFSLNEGERLGIVGESGSGKTLLARSIVKLLPSSITITHGRVVYKDNILSEMSEKQLQSVRGKEIGMVFQDPLTFLNPTKPVGVQIAEGYRRHFPQSTRLEARNVALELLHEVGIPDPENRMEYYPHELSGGQRQRVLIAIALAAKPQLLIADEPTTALDVTVQAQIMDLLKNLQQKRSTILISHDISLVANFCDRVLVMYAGEIVEDAPIDELLKNPQHPYTQQLLKSIPSLSSSERLATIPGSPPDLSKLILGCPFAPRCPHALDKCKLVAPPHHPRTRCWLKEPEC